jgi:hypothetical protein
VDHGLEAAAEQLLGGELQDVVKLALLLGKETVANLSRGEGWMGDGVFG